MKNDSIRGYFNLAQAIPAYAEVLVYLRKKLSARILQLLSLEGLMGEVSEKLYIIIHELHFYSYNTLHRTLIIILRKVTL